MLLGPREWEVKRLTASLAIAGRERGYSDKERCGIFRLVGDPVSCTNDAMSRSLGTVIAGRVRCRSSRFREVDPAILRHHGSASRHENRRKAPNSQAR